MPITLPPNYNSNQATVSTEQRQQLGDSIFLRDDIAPGIKDAVLRYRIQQVIEQNKQAGVNVTGVEVYDLTAHRAVVTEDKDSIHFAASVNKLPVGWLVLQDLRTHKIHLNDTVSWIASDVRGGYGVYDQPGAPLQATIKDIIYDMLNHSGNTAVRILVNYELGGAQAVNDRLAAYGQIPVTRLQPLDTNRFYLGNSTPGESLWIMRQLMASRDQYQQFMQQALATNIFEDYGTRSQLAGNDYIVLVNKVGILDDTDGNNRHDVGIIYNKRTHQTYGYSFMTTSPYDNTTATPQAEASLKTMGHDVLQRAGDRPAQSTPHRHHHGWSGHTHRTLY